MGTTHGKLAAVYALLPNGFDGTPLCLNDLSWGSFDTPTDSSYFEVQIDSAGGGGGGVDTFKWRENGGAWTENVDITGAEQTLSGANGDQKLTFGATTGHTVQRGWAIGNLYQEPCSENADGYATITDGVRRILNPNAVPTFSGQSYPLTRIDFAAGRAYFGGDVSGDTIICTGDNGHIVRGYLQKMGYLYEWSAEFSMDVAEVSAFGDKWKAFIAGQAEFTGSAAGYFLGKHWSSILANAAGSGDDFFLLELFSYDPDDDQSGDRWAVWATIEGLATEAGLTGAVAEEITFRGQGFPNFTANS